LLKPEDLLSRRAFLAKSVALGTGIAVLPHSRVLGANDDVRVAICGIGIKGNQHINSFQKLKGVRVVAICDPDKNRMEEALAKHFKKGDKPALVQDIRKIIEDKNIDAIVVATPNHWHALATVWACQNGKHVYTEKPYSHAFHEGQQLLATAKKYGRVMQVGTQSRSDVGLQAAYEYIKNGDLGKLKHIRGIYYNLREPIGKVDGPQPIPPGVDYDLWLGPAPKAPLMRKNLHYDWHWQWPYGNGDLGNNMVHMLDISMWMSDNHDFPRKVLAMGGRFNWHDDGVTPNTQTVFYDFGEGKIPVVCEVRNLPHAAGVKRPDNIKGSHVGVKIVGEKGYIVGYNTGAWAYDNDGKRVKQFVSDGGGTHQQNFIDAIRANKPEMVKATPTMGHLSAGLCHLGNISYKLGKPAQGQNIYDAVGSDALHHALVDDFQEHLLVNHVDVQAVPRLLGPWLSFDPAAQKFTGERADEANKHLTTTYREGFVLPEQV